MPHFVYRDIGEIIRMIIIDLLITYTAVQL